MTINGRPYEGRLESDSSGAKLTLHLADVSGLAPGMKAEIFDEDTGCTYVERHIAAIRGGSVEVALDAPPENPEDDRDAMLIELDYRLTLLELGLND